jgi:hypothetical protein
MSSPADLRRWRILGVTIAIVSIVFSTGGGCEAPPDDPDPTTIDNGVEAPVDPEVVDQ